MYKLRFAPSPTGYMHLANARIALINFIKSKQLQGKFILRIDDTDQIRSKEIYTQQIIKDLQWLDIKVDEMFYQSQRYDIYNKVIEDMKQQGMLYAAYETEEELQERRQLQLAAGQTPRYKATSTDTTRTPCWRFKIPETTITWDDELLGKQEYNYISLYDPIIIREDGSMTYILASIIDDYMMNITHVMRGRDHLSNTALQLHMLNALNQLYNTQKTITFAHFSLMSSVDGGKLSKRAESASIMYLKETGILPQTLQRFLMNLGRSESLPYEMMSHWLDSIDFSKYNTTELKCDLKQLAQDNHKFISQLNVDESLQWIQQSDNLQINLEEIQDKWEKIWHVMKDEISTLQELYDWLHIMYSHDHYPVTNDEYLILQQIKPYLHLLKQENAWDELLTIIKTQLTQPLKTVIKALRQLLTGQDHGPKMSYLLQIMPHSNIMKKFEKIKHN